MRLLADENFPRKAVETLRGLGHDVAWASREKRVVLTQDKGFSAHAFHAGLPAESGVVLFRVLPIPDLVARIAKHLFGPDADFEGRFVVVEEKRVRERPLP